MVLGLTMLVGCSSLPLAAGSPALPRMRASYPVSTVDYQSEQPLTTDALKQKILRNCAKAAIAAGYDDFQLMQYSALRRSIQRRANSIRS